MNAALHNPALVLADGWQRDFPLQPEPFAALAEPAELSQLEVMELMRSLKDQGVLARVGATVRPNTAGASTLAAMAVPQSRFIEITKLVNSFPEVAHNYARDHRLNM